MLIWTILDPGPNDDISNDVDGIRGVVATILFMMYQVTIIIILLNLLIAVMNSTIQRYQDRKQLYWKFARTSVWIDYFDDYMALPSPFSIFSVAWTLTYAFILVIHKVTALTKSRSSSHDIRDSHHMPCNDDSDKISERFKHLQLMLLLCQRHRDMYFNDMAGDPIY